MTRAQAVLVTLVVYKIVLVSIGFWAKRRTHDGDDFFLGGRRLGPWVAAISASASSSSAWSLLGVSGFAYLQGVSAIWVLPATVAGFALNWLWVAPRMLELSRAEKSVTLVESIAQDASDRWRLVLMRGGTMVLLFSFLFYVASQFQAAGDAFASTFGMGIEPAILLGAAIVVFYTLLGGFWAVSLTDTLQGLLMAATSLVLPLAGLWAVGGWADLWQGLQAVDLPDYQNLTGSHAGMAGIWFVLGTFGIGLGYPGQPHVVNRFMAIDSMHSLRKARLIALGWALIVYVGMVLVGWCGRVLAVDLANGEQVSFGLTQALFSPVVSGVMLASVLSAIMSTADSQLLVAGSSVSYDWPRAAGKPAASLGSSRLAVLLLSAVAVVVALFAPDAIFSRVLFAWHAIGSALGPLVIVRLAGRVVPGPMAALSMALGFGLTVYAHGLENAPGDAIERLLPFFLALAIAWFSSKRRPVSSSLVSSSLGSSSGGPSSKDPVA